jgi:hypothetical protein
MIQRHRSFAAWTPRMKLISFPEILRFYIPLVLTSQMMTISGPIINLAVGRAPDPKLEFAAYWIGFTILLFIESPCLVVQQITATLVRGYHSLGRLMICGLLLAGLASLTALAVALTPLGDLVFNHLVRTTPRTAELARTVLTCLSPVPFLLSLRGVGNGLAIREKRTVLVARATLFRMLSLSSVVGLVVAMKTGSGAMAGVSALTTGIAFETALIWIGVLPYWRRRRADRQHDADPLSYREIVRVAMPLVISAFAWTLFRPLVNAILGRLADPELAQAGFGVVMPLILLTSSPLWTMQNVSLVLPESREDLARIIRLAAWAAVFFSGVILLLTATPLRNVILRRVFVLSPELERAVRPALLLIFVEPFFLGARSVAQGLLLKAKRTQAYMIFAPAKIVLVAAIGLSIVHFFPGVKGTLLGIRRILRSERLFSRTGPSAASSPP